MNNGKLQAKQERLKSLHCPSPQSSLFNSRDSLLNTRFPCVVSNSPDPNRDQSAKSPSLNPQHSKESATPCPQQLFIEVSTWLLRRGQSVRFCASGQSMHPSIKEGETITVVPVAVPDIRRGDILFYILGKKLVAHRVISIKRGKNNFATQSAAYSSTLNPKRLFILRGDASLTCDEPVGTHQILGKVVSVEKSGRSLNLYSRKARMFRFAYAWTSRLKRLILQVLTVYQEVGLTFGGFR